MNQSILLDTGGDLVFDVVQGRSSSVDADLYRHGTALDESPTVTNDSCDTTINASAAAGALSLSVASATGITAGRRYLIDNGENEPEWVDVKSVSGTTVTLHRAVAYAYESGDTFVGTRVTCAVTAAAAANRGEGNECRWTFVVGGVTYKPISRWDVVRHMWPPEGQIVATWEFLEYADGLVHEELEDEESEGLDFSRELKSADNRVRRTLLARGTHHDRYRDSSEFKDAICERALLTWAEKGVNIPATYQDDPETWLEIRKAAFQSVLVDAMNTSRDYDADESGVVTEAERKQLIGTTRMVR